MGEVGEVGLVKARGDNLIIFMIKEIKEETRIKFKKMLLFYQSKIEKTKIKKKNMKLIATAIGTIKI